MASSSQQLLGFLLSVAGFAATIAATFMVEWRTYESNNGIQEINEGLWMLCTGHGGARLTCESYESLIELRTEIQVTRAVMVSSMFLASVALLVATVGMKCTRFMEGKDQAKSCLTLAAGIMFMISGLMALAVTSWFVRTIVESFFGAHHLNRYEFGNAVFVSWAGAILSMLGGLLFTCRRCCSSGSSMSPVMLRQSSMSRTDYV